MSAVTRLSILLCLSVAIFLSASVPILDEESYLAITREFNPLLPYHWWRPWPPWYGGSEPDAFVYAHPPLFLEWVALWQRFTTELAQVRWLAAAPMAALLGWSSGRLIDGVSRRPLLGLLCWLGTPIVVLGVQRGLMPDLMVAALSTTAVMGWRQRSDWRFAVLGGVALGLAGLTKYPALMLVPVFVVHGWKTGGLRSTLPFWIAAAIPWFAGELWLAMMYGRVHLWEVLTRASEIGRGTGEGRALGMLVRLPLGIGVLALLAKGRRHLWLPSFVFAACVSLWAWPDDLELEQRLVLLVCATLGAVQLVLAGFCLVRGWQEPEQNSDRLLMALWALAVLATVWGVHNFAAPRYMLAAILPLALLMVMEVGDQPRGRTLLWTGGAIQLCLALLLTLTEHRFFEASAELARAAVIQFQPTAFTGEWSFRQQMDAAGVPFYTGSGASGDIVVAPLHSSPGELPGDGIEIGRMAAEDGFPLRVVQDGSQVGLYAETLGALPLGWSTKPVEEVVAWQIP